MPPLYSADTISNTIFADVMSGIGSFTPTPDRPRSDVRIYCDDDRFSPRGRWTPVPDIYGDPNPNSRRKAGIDQEHEDVLNAIGRATDTLGCQDDGTQAETYVTLRNPQNTVANQNPRRATITVGAVQIPRIVLVELNLFGVV